MFATRPAPAAISITNPISDSQAAETGSAYVLRQQIRRDGVFHRFLDSHIQPAQSEHTTDQNGLFNLKREQKPCESPTAIADCQ